MWVNPIFRRLFWEMSLFCDLCLVLNRQTLFGDIITFILRPFQAHVWLSCGVGVHMAQICPVVFTRVEAIIETQVNEAFRGFPVCIASVRRNAKNKVWQIGPFVT